MIIGIFSHFFALETTLAERQFFRALAKLIGRRAARLSACGIAAIVSKMGYLEEGCSVGADGSLYNVGGSFASFLRGVDRVLEISRVRGPRTRGLDGHIRGEGKVSWSSVSPPCVYSCDPVETSSRTTPKTGAASGARSSPR